eukprot:g19816.t1
MREAGGGGKRGPCPDPASLASQKRARQEEREAAEAGKRGPLPGDGGRPLDSAEVVEARAGPPFFREEEFAPEQVAGEYRRFLRKWARFGLSRVCEECGTLTRAMDCKPSRHTGHMDCRNCREGKTKYTLPQLPPIPASLSSLNTVERRLLAKAHVDQVLLDKLPSGGPSAQLGRMYVMPLEEPCLSSVLDGAQLGEDGEIYVEGVQGMTASSARLQQLYVALLTLKEQHKDYQNDEKVDEALEGMAHILARLVATSGGNPGERNANEAGEVEVEPEVNYLMPRDPAIPKANLAELQKSRRAATRRKDNIDAKIFPHLFPHGHGGYLPELYAKFSEYARRRLLGQDGRFEDDTAYIMWLLEEHLKRRLSGNVNVRMKGQLQPRSGIRYEDFHRQVFTAARDLPGTQPYLYSKKGVAMSMFEQLGRPQFFLTLTCHALQPNILLAVITAKLLRENGPAMEAAELERQAAHIMHQYQVDQGFTWQGMTANQLCNSMPAIVSRQFMHSLRQLLRWLEAGQAEGAAMPTEGVDEQDRPDQEEEEEDSEEEMPPLIDHEGRRHATQRGKPPFKVLDYVVRIEWQKRGYPHAHILLWADVPDVAGQHRPEEEEESEVDWSDDEIRQHTVPASAEDLSDKYICAKSPNRWKHDEKVKPKDREMNAKLATMVVHNCSSYCGKFTIGACRFGFPRAPEKQARRRNAQEQFASRWKSTLAARRHEDDGFMCQYNMEILRHWRASMDLQVICELSCASRYILGYCFKSEEDAMARKRVDDIMQGFLQDAGRVDLTTHQVYKAAHAAMQGRTTSTFEAAHLVLGFPTVFFSRDNDWVQVGPPSTWTLSVPHHEEAEALEDPAAYKARKTESGGTLPKAHWWYGQLQQHFADEVTEIPIEGKPPTKTAWRNIPFFDFVAGFRMGKIPTGQQASLPQPRQRPAVVGHRSFSPDKEPEEFYYSKLLLHMVWTKPGDWLQEADGGSHAAAFRRIALDHDNYPDFLQSICFPKLDGTVQAARELQAAQSVMFLKAKMDPAGWVHSRAEEENYRDSMRIMQALKDRHGEDIDFLAPDHVPTGPAQDIFGPVEGGEAAFDMLTIENPSPDVLKQKRCMEYVLRSVLEGPSTKDKGNMQRLNLLVHGPGGCGKSVVTRAAAHMLRQGGKGVVLAAPTGVAAFNINGVTLHSSLPIFASKLWPLFELCELDGNQRAARDPAWAALLARVRVGQWTQEDIQTLESMVLKKYGNRKPAAGAVHLVATRRAVADGKECVESAHAEMLECPAVDISVNACTLLPPEKAWPLSEDTGGLEALLGLAVDMPVMLRKNMDVQDGLVNGARGVVQHIDVHESGEVQKIWVKFEKDAGSRWQRNNQCASVAIQRCTASFQDKDGDKAERRQFPLVLAKAVAIHKSQAATYHEGVHARLDASVKQEGQAYVALSRSPTKDLCTLERFDPKSLRFNANAEWALLKLKAKQAQSTGPRKPALQELWQEVIRPTEDAAYYQGKLACATPPDWKAYAEEQRLKDLEVEEGKAGSLTCPKCGFVATDTTNYKKHGRVCPAKNKKSQRPKVAGKAKAKPAMKDSKRSSLNPVGIVSPMPYRWCQAWAKGVLESAKEVLQALSSDDVLDAPSLRASKADAQTKAPVEKAHDVDDVLPEQAALEAGCMDFQSKTAYLDDGRSLRLQLWDTAGQDRRLIDGLQPTSDGLQSRGEAVLALVGNKSDLASDRQVSEEEGKELAKELGVIGGENVTALFQQLASVLPGEAPAAVQEDRAGFHLQSQEHRPETEKKKKQCKC